MSKKFFRFLRGEINGFYLNKINESCNELANEIKDFICDFRNMQFKDENEVTGEETPITAGNLEGISIFTGVFPPYVWQESLVGSIRFTSTKKINGIEYSERGLYSPEEETFSFVRTTQEEYTDDINTLSSPSARSTFVEEGRQPLGYFPEGVNVIKDDGTIDLSQLLSSPRPGHADSPYYGDNFLFLSEESPILAITSNLVLIYVIRAMQWIRYNGISISSLSKFASIICPGFLFITSIDWDSHYAYAIVSYGIDEDYEAEDKMMREQLFALLVGKKIAQFSLNKVGITVERDTEGNVISVNVL